MENRTVNDGDTSAKCDFVFDPSRYTNVAAATLDEQWTDGDRSDVATIRNLHSELSHWGEYAIAAAWIRYSDDVHMMGWYEHTNSRDENFLNYLCWQQTRGDWNWGSDEDLLKETSFWKK